MSSKPLIRRFALDCWPMLVFVGIWLVVGITEPPTAIAFLGGAYGIGFCWFIERTRRESA